VEGARGGCGGYEEIGCSWGGSGGVVSWAERVTDGRSVVCVWAKCLFAPRGVALPNFPPPDLPKQTFKKKPKKNK